MHPPINEYAAARLRLCRKVAAKSRNGTEMTEKERILQVKDLDRSYTVTMQTGEKTEYPVLKKISFDVEYGEFIAIMGRSGCGKTTLLKTIGMMDKPTRGEVLYKNQSTAKIFGDNLARIRRKEIGFVFQDFYLMDSLSVKDNIMVPLILDGMPVQESLQKMGKYTEQFQITHLLNKKPYELSGGEKQRTAICRAMIADSDLLLADEPTGNLDSHSSRNVIRTLVDINEKYGKTVLLVTHDPGIASYAARIIFLKDGEILEDEKRVCPQEIFYQEIIHRMEFL